MTHMGNVKGVEVNYYVDRIDGTGALGDTYTLSYSPIKIDFVFYRKKNPTQNDKPVAINFNTTAAGTTECTVSGSGGRFLSTGSNILIPTDNELTVGYWAYGVGYNSSLSAVAVSEQYDLQGDSESVTVKEKALTVETNADSHFVTNVSGTSATDLTIRTKQENITNMPYNKFKIVGAKMTRTRDNAALNWVDWKLYFCKQDDFYAAKNDPDLDDVGPFIDFASCMICSLGSTVEEAGEVTNYIFWPNRKSEVYAGALGGGHPVASFATPWPIYYEDEDGTNELHLLLENKSDVSHESGANKIKFHFQIEPLR